MSGLTTVEGVRVRGRISRVRAPASDCEPKLTLRAMTSGRSSRSARLLSAGTLRAAGLRERGPYNIRDTFITLALSAGEDPGWVAALCGTSESMIFRHYRKGMPSGKRTDGAAVARALGRSCHQGYEPKQKDVQDLLLLHEKFGVPLPFRYSAYLKDRRG
jgi:hypothetical protein